MGYEDFSLNRGRNRTIGRFPLTPLADAMFQLLLFFMLTTSLDVYSLVTLQDLSERDLQPKRPDVAPTRDQSAPLGTLGEQGVFVLRLQRLGTDAARLAYRNQTYPPAEYDGIRELLAAQGVNARVLLVVDRLADVQDFALVMEMLASTGVSAIEILDGGL